MYPRNYVWLLVFFFAVFLSACTDQHSQASVTDIWRQPLKSSTIYTVQRGDTLFSIAWSYDLDYRQVAALNGISAPHYHIKVGQKIKLMPASAKSSAAKTTATTPDIAPLPLPQPISPSAPVSAPIVNNEPAQCMSVRTVNQCGINWAWPAQGNLLNTFSGDGLDKGLDIAGKAGSPVLAAATGKVVYAGSGLHGYGELIIIKHNDEFLSAYAHNQKLLVQEGQSVRVGQVIARMGDTEAKSVMLHFEIRRAGKPVDPQKYLPAH